MEKSLLVHSNISERSRRFDNLDKTINFLAERTKKTYYLQGIENLEILSDGLKILFNVIETDDHLIKLGMQVIEKEFFITRYVWSHLSGFLSVPNKVYDYWQLMKELPLSKFIECQDHESEVIKILFNHRVEQVKTTRKKNIYLTIFNDQFGEFPRVIHSDIYYPYPDLEALETLMTGMDTVNEQNGDRDYMFRSSYLSPYQSTFNFTNKLTNTKAVHGKNAIESGISVTNSECKRASYNFQAYILRLVCSNGSTSRFRDKELNVKHYESGFRQKIQAGFVKALELEDVYAAKYINAVNYDQPISNDWADLLKLPASILALERKEKEELIDIGINSDDNEFTPYNVLQAITYKSSHKSYTDNTKARFNDKGNQLLEKIAALQKWVPNK